MNIKFLLLMGLFISQSCFACYAIPSSELPLYNEFNRICGYPTTSPRIVRITTPALTMKCIAGEKTDPQEAIILIKNGLSTEDALKRPQYNTDLRNEVMECQRKLIWKTIDQSNLTLTIDIFLEELDHHGANSMFSLDRGREALLEAKNMLELLPNDLSKVLRLTFKFQNSPNFSPYDDNSLCRLIHTMVQEMQTLIDNVENRAKEPEMTDATTQISWCCFPKLCPKKS